MTEFADWTRAFVMMGDSPVGIREVLLGADGSLYALLQGMTPDDELRTVRLDDEGHLSAFVIDSVDAWNRMLTIGNAELAARLGSPVNYDRRGQVLFIETFKEGWHKWVLDKDGNNAAGELTPVAFAADGYSVKLTGGSTTDFLAGVHCRVPSRPVGQMGMEFSFAVPAFWDYIHATMYFYTATQILTSSVKFIRATGALMLLDEAVGYTLVGTGKVIGSSAKEFNVLKLVANVDTLKYVRLLLNQQEISLSNYTVKQNTNLAIGPSIKMNIVLYSRDGFNDVMYLDTIILTGAEPE